MRKRIHEQNACLLSFARWRAVAVRRRNEADVCQDGTRVQGAPRSPADETEGGAGHHRPLGRGRIYRIRGGAPSHDVRLRRIPGTHVSHSIPCAGLTGPCCKGEEAAFEYWLAGRGGSTTWLRPRNLRSTRADVSGCGCAGGDVISEIDLRSRRTYSCRAGAGL